MAQIPDDPSLAAPLLAQIRANFLHLGLTRDIAFRKQALRTLLAAYQEFIPKINEALRKDLGYNEFMSSFATHSLTKAEISHLISGMSSWAKPHSIPTPVAMGFACCSTKAEPMGVVLVVSAWNYPIYTALPQLAAAISAGNAVILKPSEMAPYSSNVLKEMFEKHMDKRFYRVLEGKVEVARAITSLPFDLICFTGSTQTGKFVAIAAAKNLTPCLLELGGKCPVIVDETAKLQSAALRILAGKFLNCGQTCIGVDHLFVHESQKVQFKRILLETAKTFYEGEDLMNAGNYGKIINDFHFSRVQKYLTDDHKGQIIYGGNMKREERYISPTIIESPNPECLMMQEEIFGPIMPIFYYSDIREVVKKIQAQPKPLVVYIFSESKQHINLVERQTSSGSFVVNEAVMQMLNADLPFGGVGASGSGRYHGESGFIAFSNIKSVLKSMAVNSFPLNQRFPPYTQSKKNMLQFLLKYGSITYQQIGKAMFFLLLLIVVIVLGVTLLPRAWE